jgi:hypothetical protein
MRTPCAALPLGVPTFGRVCTLVVARVMRQLRQLRQCPRLGPCRNTSSRCCTLAVCWLYAGLANSMASSSKARWQTGGCGGGCGVRACLRVYPFIDAFSFFFLCLFFFLVDFVYQNKPPPLQPIQRPSLSSRSRAETCCTTFWMPPPSTPAQHQPPLTLCRLERNLLLSSERTNSWVRLG